MDILSTLSDNFNLMKKSNILRSLGEQIRDQRIKKGWSQEGFALKCQLDRSYIGKIERGERNVTLLTLYQIAKTLDLQVKDLIGKIQDEEK